MPIAITMKDTMISETLDIEYPQAMDSLNNAAAKGITFISFDDMHGTHVLINIPQILIVREIDD